MPRGSAPSLAVRLGRLRPLLKRLGWRLERQGGTYSVTVSTGMPERQLLAGAVGLTLAELEEVVSRELERRGWDGTFRGMDAAERSRLLSSVGGVAPGRK